MSVSYTVGGKSQTRQRGKKEENSAVSTPLNRGKRQSANLTAFHRTSNVNAARDQPVGGAGAQRRPQKTIGIASGAKSDPNKIKTQVNLGQSERQSNIVTLSDLKASGEKKEGKHLPRKTPTNSSNVNHHGVAKKLVNNSSSPKAISVSKVSGRKVGHPSPEKESVASRTLVNRTTGSARTVAHEYASLGSPNLEIRNSKLNSLQPQPLAKIQSQRTATNKVSTGRGANSNSNNISTATAKLKQSPRSKKGRVGKMASPGYGGSRSVGQRPSQGQGQDESDPSLQGQASPQQQQQPGSAQYDGSAGFTRIAPNQGKREKLTSMASKELAELEKRKEARRSVRIEGPEQTTGGRKSEEDARLEMERQHRTKSRYEQRMKTEKYKREKREREDKELAEKKAKAREQTKKNAQMRAEREASFLRNEHQRTNEDFLRRVEAGKRSPSDSSSSTSPELQMLIEMFPGKSPAKLQEMLSLTGGDVGKVIDLLQ